MAAERHLPLLDQLRGFAIFWVFGFHALGFSYKGEGLPWKDWIRNFASPPGDASYYLWYPFSIGYLGVAIFFVVSGFCIHLSHAGGRDDWRGFFHRRFFRIYPPYLLALLFFAFLWPTFRLRQPGSDESLATLLRHVLLVHPFTPESTLLTHPINPSFWTIGVEVQLYLLYPVLHGIARRSSWGLALVLAAAIEAGLRTILAFQAAEQAASSARVPGVLEFLPFTYWGSWALGAWLADAHLCGRVPSFPRGSTGAAWAVVAIASVVRPLDKFMFPLGCVATAIALGNHLARRSPGPGPVGGFARHFAFAGGCSYSFYLLHQPIAAGFYNVLKGRFQVAEPWLLMLLTLALWIPLLLVSQASLTGIEKPFIALGRSLRQRPPASATERA